MRKILVIIIAFVMVNGMAKAQPGDTIKLKTFTFGSPQDAWFVFPSDTVKFEKILMKYKLKCNPAMSPACGEWDYLTYTYLYDHTGLTDSAKIIQAGYTVNGVSPDSVQYMNTPTYSYNANWQYFITHSDTSSLSTPIIGAEANLSIHPFGTALPVSKSQYLWRASELSGAGVMPGNITGLQFYLSSIGVEMRNLTIRIKATAEDSLSQANFTSTGFTTVYLKNTQFPMIGWNSLQFTNAFNWDGTSNLIIEITFDNTSGGAENVVYSSTAAFQSTLYKRDNDRYADLGSSTYIDVPVNNDLITIDSTVTISYWAYGNPAKQPQDGTCFEALDSLNNRVLNVHGPWSDSNIYWDAGQSGGYDRINKAATTSQIEGQWNYWTFTKNVATGSMKIYLNGVLWHSGTGKTKVIPKINKFRIGKGLWGGSQSYEGRMDDFAVFYTELSAATIADYMHKSIDMSHPNYANLVMYHRFDDGNYVTTTDEAAGAHPDAYMLGAGNPLKSSSDYITQFNTSFQRPNTIFEQGVYTSVIDSVLVMDSTLNAPFQVLLYNDSVVSPGVPTDTLLVWPVGYTDYVYDAAGNATDSTLLAADSTLYLWHYDYYNYFPQVIRYELGRYITPYGIGLSLGDGWTWTFDVSDYRTLLADSVHLAAGNWQELLDMEFWMIKGTPPRDVLGIQNLWTGGFNYGDPTNPIDTYLTPITVDVPAGAVNSRWKSRVTGHGMDTPENCAEFCPKTHYYKVNGTQQFSQLVWRDNCDINPLYPQGGTWVYDRSNWCPGAEVWTYDWELTPHVTPGATATLDHDVQAYVHTGGWDYYQIEDQVVWYGAPNFTNDASLVDVMSPSDDDMWRRMNPRCTSPIIKIQNTGSANLTSLTITYGINGATPTVYTWTGNLKFMETATVTLGTFNWATGADKFTVTLSQPNGVTDEYVYNNSMTTKFNYVTVLPEKFVMELKTNNNYFENQWTIKDDAGAILYSRAGAAANTFYRDTINLATGCYELELTDSGEDGLSFWAHTAAGSGFLRIRKADVAGIIKSFGADFGGQIYMQFTVGLTNSMEDYILTTNLEFNVYPNPTNGMVNIDVNMLERNNGSIEITDITGRKLYTHGFQNVTAESAEFNLSPYGSGTYFVTLRTDKNVVTKKVMLQR